MKYIFTFLFFTISLYCQEWVNQNPSFSKYDVKDICFINKDTGFVVMGPLIYRTFSGGNNFELIYHHNASFVNQFYFDSVFFVLSKEFIFKSSDFGNSFTSYPMDTGNFDFLKARFTDKNHGWLISGLSNGYMRKTTDGGLSWSAINLPTRIGNIFFTDSLNGYATSGYYDTREYIYKTVNGGISWTRTFVGYGLQNAPIAFLSDSIGFAGIKPHVFTTDAGNTWTLKDTLGVTYVKKNYGMNISMGDYKKTAHITYDMGINWKEVFTPVNEYGAVFDIGDSLTLYSGNHNGELYKSTDMGDTWFCLTNPAFDLGRSFFTDEKFGFITGRNNMRTFDGGEKWEVLFTKKEIYNPYFINKEKGFAFVSRYDVNDYSNILTVLRTFNSGSSWDSIMSFKTQFKRAKFYFRDSINGYLIFHEQLGLTSDGGETWSFKPVNSPVYDIMFIDSEYGYMACLNTGFRTSDGGNTWIESPNLYGHNIYFADHLVGFKSYDYALMKTINGGASFYDLINHGQNDWFEHLKFYNKTYGIIKFGYHNTILKTVDAGDNWETIFPVAGIDIDNFSIFFPSFYTGWVTGTEGSIYKYISKPLPVELISFKASQAENIILEWSTVTEKNNSGFELLKKKENEAWQNISFIPGFGTSAERKDYKYIDSELREGSFSYKLIQVDLNGTRTELNEIKIEIVYPDRFVLYQNYPNPFNPSTIIKYQIPEQNLVIIKLYNSIGEELKVLESSFKEKGKYELSFNAAELNLPSGVYIYSVQAGELIAVKKMMLIK